MKTIQEFEKSIKRMQILGITIQIFLIFFNFYQKNYFLIIANIACAGMIVWSYLYTAKQKAISDAKRIMETLQQYNVVDNDK